MKLSRRYLWLLQALLCACPLLAGCELFNQFTSKKNERVEKDPVAGAPGKYSMRVSQFVFLSDVELRRDQAIFKDLSNLREQVYRELLTFMMADPSTINRATHLLWVAHNIERIADRVTNICERTVFIATGEMGEIKSSDDEFWKNQQHK